MSTEWREAGGDKKVGVRGGKLGRGGVEPAEMEEMTILMPTLMMIMIMIMTILMPTLMMMATLAVLSPNTV